jgi:exosortase/archaeosortase family protein
LIIAVPCVEWKKRLAGILIGIPILWIGNIARIFLIVLIGINYGFEAAELVHTYLWQLGLISLVLLIWLIWLYWVGKIFKTKSKSNLNG